MAKSKVPQFDATEIAFLESAMLILGRHGANMKGGYGRVAWELLRGILERAYEQPPETMTVRIDGVEVKMLSGGVWYSGPLPYRVQGGGIYDLKAGERKRTKTKKMKAKKGGIK